MIQTVNGLINKNQFGIASAHEHVFIDMKNCVSITGEEKEIFYKSFTPQDRYAVNCDPYAILDNALMDEYDIALKELKQFKRYGGATIVDCTLDEIGRDANKLKKISVESGVNILIGTGHYYHKAHFNYVKKSSIKELYEEIKNDLTVGVQGTDIKAGLIGEIGTSATISDDEKKCLRAGGMASCEFNKAIHVHTDLYTENGFEIINILKSEGVKPQKICIDHIDVWIRPDYIFKLLDQGVYVEFDNFGKEFFINNERRFAYDLERIKIIKEIINKGYTDQILISNDICLKSMLAHYGGNGYSHILDTVKLMALENGISENIYKKILTNNVWEFLK